MPGGDRTGPLGAGPATGRGFGYCRGNDRPGFAAGRGGRGFARGFGRGFGFGAGGYGRGRRNRYFATGIPGWAWDQGYPETYRQTAYEGEPAPVADDELAAIREQLAVFEESLQDINRRLDEIKKRRS